MASGRRQPFIPIAPALRARFPDHPDDVLADRRVLVDGRLITNPNARIRRDATIRLLPVRRLRGDVKLATALGDLAVACTGVVAVDVGAAAGGFTTALLRAGARRVYAVDTGYGQLRGILRADPRVMSLERTNVDALGPALVPDVVDVVTMDLSYTSIAAAVRSLDGLRLATGARLIALVKPTFELAAGTVVLDRPRVEAAIAMACGAIEAAGWRCDAITLPSPSGRHGAIEAFVLASVRTGPGRVGGVPPKDMTPSDLIDARIDELGDWRGETLSRLRALIHEAVPDVVEEWKWRGVPTWEHEGMICTGETYKNYVKVTFAKGASLDDPAGLFNSSLEGNVRRAIDFHEGEKINTRAFKALIKAGAALNESKIKRR